MAIPQPCRTVYTGVEISIQILDRELAEKTTADEPYASIAITNDEGPFGRLAPSPNQKGVLCLRFADIPFRIEDDEGLFPDIFSEEQAERILDFYTSMRATGVRLFLINCEMGRHRSAAVGAALSMVANGESRWFLRHFAVNRLVYDTLLAVYQRRQQDVRHRS